jgi:NADPH:quinone reductase-like Zn-dependent oxidoreductase
MKANRIHRLGPPEVIVFEEVEKPSPGAGEVLVAVKASGAGPWDGWIRAGTAKVDQSLPLTLGSDLSGLVETVGPHVTDFAPGNEVFGINNARFTEANAEYAVASVGMIALKPRKLGFIEAASMPVVAVTAWQMLFDHAASCARPNCVDPRSRRQCGCLSRAVRPHGARSCHRHRVGSRC